jgi:hypothetical protein
VAIDYSPLIVAPSNTASLHGMYRMFGMTVVDYTIVIGDNSIFVLIEQQAKCYSNALNCVKVVQQIMQVAANCATFLIPEI